MAQSHTAGISVWQTEPKANCGMCSGFIGDVTQAQQEGRKTDLERVKEWTQMQEMPSEVGQTSALRLAKPLEIGPLQEGGASVPSAGAISFLCSHEILGSGGFDIQCGHQYLVMARVAPICAFSYPGNRIPFLHPIWAWSFPLGPAQSGRLLISGTGKQIVSVHPSQTSYSSDLALLANLNVAFKGEESF